MEPFQQHLSEYRKQLAKGDVKEAYKGLMEYIENLKLHFKNKYPNYFVSSSIHYGFMDYTYFYFFPKSLKRQKLKVVLLFIHDSFSFEVWLSGYNKAAQSKYLRLFKEGNWNKYPLAPTIQGIDYITKNTLTDDSDFSDLEALTEQIENGALKFIQDIETFLSTH
jgi:hypothetical protein